MPPTWRQFGSVEVFALFEIAIGVAAIGAAAAAGVQATALFGIGLLVLAILELQRRYYRLEVAPEVQELRVGLRGRVRLAEIREIRLALSGATFDCAYLVLAGGQRCRVRRLRMAVRSLNIGSGRWELRGCIWISRWVERATGELVPVLLEGSSERMLDETMAWATKTSAGQIVFPDQREDESMARKPR